MEDKLDNKIKNAFSEDIEIPSIFTNSIYTAFDKQKTKNRSKILNFKKISAIACSIILVTVSTVVIGNMAYQNYYSKEVYGIVDEGIKVAVDNEYMENVNMDYAISNGIGVKINQVIMDDFNLNIAFEYKFDEPISTQFPIIQILDLLITDENNNLIFCDDIKTYEKFCKENKITYSKNSAPKTYTNGGYGRQPIEVTPEKFITLYTMYSDCFPKSKKLYITFSKIAYGENYLMNPNDCTVKKGKWKMEIDLPEKFYNRKVISYTAIENEYINVTRADVNNTGMKLEFEMKKDSNIPYAVMYDSLKIVNENGKEFGVSMAGEGSFFTDGNEVYSTFTITEFDATDKLEIVLTNKNLEQVLATLIKNK